MKPEIFIALIVLYNIVAGIAAWNKKRKKMQAEGTVSGASAKAIVKDTRTDRPQNNISRPAKPSEVELALTANQDPFKEAKFKEQNFKPTEFRDAAFKDANFKENTFQDFRGKKSDTERLPDYAGTKGTLNKRFTEEGGSLINPGKEWLKQNPKPPEWTGVLQGLRERGKLQQAFILKEIFDKPVSRR